MKNRLARLKSHTIRRPYSSSSSQSPELDIDPEVLTAISPRATSILNALAATSPDHNLTSNSGNRTLRRRIGLAGTALPLPPILDPLVDAQRRSTTQPRPLQRWNDPTPFQRELCGNAFAQILATPIRRDTTTQTLYPLFFLQSFATAFRPPTSTTKTIRNRIPRGKLVPHILPVESDASPRWGPKSHALAGARMASLKQRGWTVVGVRQQARYGLGRDQWCVDYDAVKAEAEDLVLSAVVGHLMGVVQRGLLKGHGVTVILDPQACDATMDAEEGYVFILPPALARKEWAKDLGGVVRFAMGPDTVGAVVALFKMDLFYRSERMCGRDEILRLWKEEKSDE